MFPAILFAASLVFSPDDARFAHDRARELVEQCTPRDAGTIRGRIASNFILDSVSAVGVDVRRDVFRAKTPKGEREFINLYAEFRGDPDDRWVVLASHYDTKPGTGCPGANDGASTSGLLMAMANAVSNWADRHGNLMLVWVDGEECMVNYGPDDGLWGSRRAAEYLSERNRKVQAVICVDMLGDAELEMSIPSNGTQSLARIAGHAARKAGYPELVKPMPEVVKDDHVPFLERGYKAIDIIDFNYGPNNSYWHSPNDTIEAISVDSLLKSGRVMAEMLNILL